MTDLDDGDLRMHVDFRSVYSDLLTNWLQLPAAANQLGREVRQPVEHTVRRPIVDDDVLALNPSAIT